LTVVQHVDVCPYHNRVQEDVDDQDKKITGIMVWQGRTEERIKGIDEKLDKVISMLQWAIGVGLTVILAIGGMFITHIIQK